MFIGADEIQAEHMVKVLCISKEKNDENIESKPCYKYIKSLLKVYFLHITWY